MERMQHEKSASCKNPNIESVQNVQHENSVI